MVWGNKGNKAPQDETPSMPDKPVTRKALPAELKDILDRDDHESYDESYASYSVDSTDTSVRYAAYGSRIRTILLSAHRYVAYTSDIGESFRPVAHPWLIRSAYGVSWAYLLGDVSHEGYKAYLRNRRALTHPGEAYKDASDVPQNQIIRGMAMGNLSRPLGDSSELEPWPTTEISLAEDYRMIMAKRAVFQSVASMGLPALTIHSVVKYSGRMLKGSKATFVRTWVPIGLGLAVVPALPYLFDHPVEEAVDWAFGTGLRLYGGEDAVRPLPPHARGLSHGHEPNTEVAKEGPVAAAAQLSWEEYKNGRDQARQVRQEQQGGQSWSSWIWPSSGSDEKTKND